MRQVIVYPGEDNYCVVECPSLPGCISQGKNCAEALDNIKDAIEAYISALEEDNLEIPEDRFEQFPITRNLLPSSRVAQ